jgi:hypothetical protein
VPVFNEVFYTLDCSVQYYLDEPNIRAAILAYLLFNDPVALVELGFPPGKIDEMRQEFILAEQRYIDYVVNYYKTNGDLPAMMPPNDHFWRVYLGIEQQTTPTNIAPTPTPTQSPTPYADPPFSIGNGSIYLSGSFAKVSIASNNEIIIESMSSETRPLSSIAVLYGYSGSSAPTTDGQVRSVVRSGRRVYVRDDVAKAYLLFTSSNASVFVGNPFSTTLLNYYLGLFYKDSNGKVRLRGITSFNLLSPILYNATDIVNKYTPNPSTSISVLSL